MSYKLSDLLDEKNTKIIYVYDFINMWTFLVELAAVKSKLPVISIPSYSRMEKCRMSLRKKL
jgi:hypothetical protein